MNIETLEVSGLFPAIHGMRNPMDSWAKSDSLWSRWEMQVSGHVGGLDRDLSERLQMAGPEHAKHLRMVNAYADISAPRYWWNEFDTYRAGVEKVSCSTMHRLMARPLNVEDFEIDKPVWDSADEGMLYTIACLNRLMEQYKSEQDPGRKKEVWRQIIQRLPQSYIQRRTVMMSYAALRNIYRQREGHKLKEWQQFREWVLTLPENWMITV